MYIVLLIAFGVGMSTVVGSLAAMFFKKISHRTNDAILSFAAGVMLGASFLSLIIPSLEMSGGYLPTIFGILFGALFISLIDRFVPHLHGLIGTSGDKSLNRVILFLIAIAFHNFPEGLAVGVSFGANSVSNAFALAIGISVQNIPEGMITILPLLLVGVSKKRAVLIALFTGMTEVLGVLIGYLAASLSLAVLPFVLAAAGGAMLYVISNDMIPETHSHGYEKTASYSLILGIIVMLIIEALL